MNDKQPAPPTTSQIERWRNPTHIGDGVYVTFDGFQLWLNVERSSPDADTLAQLFASRRIEQVALEPATYAQLRRYVLDDPNLRARFEPDSPA